VWGAAGNLSVSPPLFTGLPLSVLFSLGRAGKDPPPLPLPPLPPPTTTTTATLLSPPLEGPRLIDRVLGLIKGASGTDGGSGGGVSGVVGMLRGDVNA
jgi:hypothetical protein